MLRTFAINEKNDFALDRAGNLQVLEGAQAIADVCRNAVQDQLGEMLYAMADGMPTAATVFNNYNPSQFEAAARGIILSVQGVREIESFTVNRVGEVLRYSAVITLTTAEQVTVNG